MVEISLLICIALIFLAYTQAYYNRDSIPLCALFAASTSTLYFFWLRVRAKIVARVMEKIAAANAAYHRAEHAVAQTYYSTARRTLAVVDKVESAIQTLYDIPRHQKFLTACLATTTVWIIAFFHAWYTEEEETMIVIVVVPCGILSIPLGWSMGLFQQYELHNADPASCKALDTYTPSPQPEIPARPETPTEKRRRERAAKHEANQVQLRRSWQKDEEQKKWEDEHRDGLGRAPLCSLYQSSPRCSKSGVHYPQPIVFPEDLPPTPPPKPQLTSLPPTPALPEPQPEPKPKPYDEQEYQSLLADLRESLGLLPTKNTATPTNNGSTQQPVQKPTTGDDDQPAPSQQSPHEPNDSRQKNEKPQLPHGHPHTWQKAGMTAADVWMAYQPSSMTTSHHFDYQQLFIATGNAPTLAFGNYPRPAEQEKDKEMPNVAPPPLEMPGLGGNSKPQSGQRPNPFSSFSSSSFGNSTDPGGASSGAKSSAHGTGSPKPESEDVPKPSASGGGTSQGGSSFGQKPSANNANGTSGSQPPPFGMPMPYVSSGETKQGSPSFGQKNTPNGTSFGTNAHDVNGFGPQAHSTSSGADVTGSQKSPKSPPAQDAPQLTTGLPGLFTGHKAPKSGSSSTKGQPYPKANTTPGNKPFSSGGASAMPESTPASSSKPSMSTQNLIQVSRSISENRSAVKEKLDYFMNFFKNVRKPLNSRAAWSPPMDERAFKLEAENLAECLRELYSWVYSEDTKKWDTTNMDMSTADDCYMGPNSGEKLWRLQETFRILLREKESCSHLRSARTELARLQDLYKASFSKNTSRPIARGKSAKLAPSGANASPRPASNSAAAAQGPEMSGNLPNPAPGSAQNAKPLGARSTPQPKANPFAFAQAPDFSHNLPKFAQGNSGNGSKSAFNGTTANSPGGAQPFASGGGATSSTNIFGSPGTSNTGANSGTSNAGHSNSNGRKQPSAGPLPAQASASASIDQEPGANPLLHLMDDKAQRKEVRKWMEQMRQSFLGKGPTCLKQMHTKTRDAELELTRKRLDWICDWAAPGGLWDMTRLRSLDDVRSYVGTNTLFTDIDDRFYGLEGCCRESLRGPCHAAFEAMMKLLKAQEWKNKR